MASRAKTPDSRVCVDCGLDFRPGHFIQVRCFSCVIHSPYVKAGRRAHAQVYAAVRRGEIPVLTGEIPCVDCGRAAQQYDHRDYNKPLDVDPVCRSCNYKRGPAAFTILPPPEQDDAAKAAA